MVMQRRHPLIDYAYYTGSDEIRIILKPYSVYQNYSYITCEQKELIDFNYNAARGNESYGKPYCVPKDCINFAGEPVSIDEALFYVVPYEIERDENVDEHQLFGNYIIRCSGRNTSINEIVPYGTWQQVPTLASQINGWVSLHNNSLGFCPNNNFLPYERWFIETREVFQEKGVTPELAILILSYWKWWDSEFVNHQDGRFSNTSWYVEGKEPPEKVYNMLQHEQQHVLPDGEAMQEGWR